MTYTLVSESEADFKAGKLSITTPIAKALIGKKLGDKVEVQVPAGTDGVRDYGHFHLIENEERAECWQSKIINLKS